ELTAEQLSRRLACCEGIERFAQGARYAVGAAVARVALRRLGRCELVLDAPQTRADTGSDGDARVDVRRALPMFDAQRLRVAAADDAQGAGAVLDAPRGHERRPQPRHVALVAVYRGRDHQGELLHQRELTRKVVSHDRRHAALGASVVECIPSPLPQTLMQVAAAPWVDRTPL